jgi:hypothetical protein
MSYFFFFLLEEANKKILIKTHCSKRFLFKIILKMIPLLITICQFLFKSTDSYCITSTVEIATTTELIQTSMNIFFPGN